MSPVCVKKPKAIVMDITGTLVAKSFMTYSQESKAFMLKYSRDFVTQTWGKNPLKLVINFIRQDIKNNNTKGPPLRDMKASIDEQVEGVLTHLQYRFDNEWKSRSPAIGIFHLAISDWGYKKNLLKTP